MRRLVQYSVFFIIHIQVFCRSGVSVLQPTASIVVHVPLEANWKLRSADVAHDGNSTFFAVSKRVDAAFLFPHLRRQIFVGGLHYETRDASLQTYFEQFGPVQTAEVMFNRETHKSRGFGFVVFESEESANAVLQSTHHTVNGKVVEVKRAVPRAQSSTGGSNPSSPAMMGYPPSPSALGPGMGGGALSKSAAAAGPKRPQRPRAPRDAMAAPNSSSVPPGASPQQQRYAPTTSYAAVLRYGAGRQQHTSIAPHGAGKPPQHHGHMQGRDDIGGFRLHGTHTSFLPPSATARAEAAAAHAFVQELKAWDVENPGQGLSFEEPFDYYGEQQQRGIPREYAAHSDVGGGGSGEASYNTTASTASNWPGPGPGSGSSSRGTWAQQAGQGNASASRQQQVHRPPGDATRMLAQNSRVEDVSPRRVGPFSTFSRPGEGGGVGSDGSDAHSHLYRSHAAQNGEALGDAQNGRLLSPGEGGGKPALMSSSPLLGGGGLLETAFAELKLDGSHPMAMNPSLADGPVPNGDGPSLLNGIGGGGPPSAASEVLPYGRAGGETALDGGGGTDGLAGSGVWRADAFGSALGVNVASTANEMGGAGGDGAMSERKDITAGGLAEHFVGVLGTAGAEGATSQVNMGWH